MFVISNNMFVPKSNICCAMTYKKGRCRSKKKCGDFCGKHITPSLSLENVDKREPQWYRWGRVYEEDMLNKWIDYGLKLNVDSDFPGWDENLVFILNQSPSERINACSKIEKWMMDDKECEWKMTCGNYFLDFIERSLN